jgi:hypothetical protein
MMLTKGLTWRRILAPLAIMAMVVAGLAPGSAPAVAADTGAAAPAAAGTLQQAFKAAVAEFGVPESILLSVSYNLSRWEHHDGRPSTSGGYGHMARRQPAACLRARPTGTAL